MSFSRCLSNVKRWVLRWSLPVVMMVLSVPDAWGATCFAVSGEVTYKASTLLNEWQGVNRSLYGELQSVGPEEFRGWACVDMSAWDSGNTTRDKHARIMFEVEKYPEACYTLQGVQRRGTSVIVQGVMQIHGVGRPLSMEGQLIEGSDSSFRLKARFQTQISDWGMTPPRLMAVMSVKDQVHVEVDARLRPSACGQVTRHPSGTPVAAGDKAAVYEAYCSFCHMPRGQGQGYYPPVTHVATFLRHPEGRSYLARVVMYGLFGPIEVGGKRYEGFLMPSFGELMDDAMLARLLNEILFVLHRPAPTGVPPYTPEEVRRYRTPPATPADMWKVRQRIVQGLREGAP